jgi:hypothetical protein
MEPIQAFMVLMTVLESLASVVTAGSLLYLAYLEWRKRLVSTESRRDYKCSCRGTGAGDGAVWEVRPPGADPDTL